MIKTSSYFFENTIYIMLLNYIVIKAYNDEFLPHDNTKSSFSHI